jgi:glycerate dehydrogenase
MKIVILDGYTLNPGDLKWNRLKDMGEVICHDRTPGDKIVSRIGGAEIVLTNKTPISREVMEACPNMRFVSVLATGYNVVDTQAAKELGILVSNVPTYGTASVAQFVFALLLEICHHVQHHSNTVMEGRWTGHPDFCYWDYPLIELADKTMGIIGFGKIGRQVARLANAFGMKVLAYDTHRNDKFETGDIKYSELDELFAASDVVSLHCPLSNHREYDQQAGHKQDEGRGHYHQHVTGPIGCGKRYA